MGKNNRISFHKKKIKKRDDENILSRDIDIEADITTLERLNDKSGVHREMSNINYSKSFVKSLKFKPQKYKGIYLSYHLRWIFSNSIKSNEISLVQEIKALETEIVRLKQMKLLNREFRKKAGLPYGMTTSYCNCCNKLERTTHDCSHLFCIKEKCEKYSQNIQNLINQRTLKGALKNVFEENLNTLYDVINNKSNNKKIYFRTYIDTSNRKNNDMIIDESDKDTVNSIEKRNIFKINKLN